jgi:hypothetical protein
VDGLSTVATIALVCATIVFAAASFDFIRLGGGESPDLPSMAMLWLIPEHIVFGSVLVVGVVGAGLGVTATATTLSHRDRCMLAIPIGLALWLVVSIVVRAIGWPGWIGLVLISVFAGLSYLRMYRRFLPRERHFLPDVSPVTSVAVIGTGWAFSAFFALVWRLPSQYAGGTVNLGDLSTYSAFYQDLKVSFHPAYSLAVEGDAGGYINQISSFLALLFDGIPGFEISYFLTASVAAFFFFAMCFSIRILIAGDGEALTAKPPKLLLAAIALILCGATRYPSWIVETPPFAFAAPIAVSIAYLGARAEQRPKLFYGLLPLVVIAFAITKVVLLAVVAPYVFFLFLQNSYRRKDRAALIALAIGAIFAAAFAGYLVVTYGGRFLALSSADYYGPESLEFLYHKVFVQGGRLIKALRTTALMPTFGQDVAPILLLVGASRLRNMPLFLATFIGVALFYVSPFLFNGTLAASFLLIACVIVLNARQKVSRLALAMFSVAALLMVRTHTQTDKGGWQIALFWLTTFGGACYLTMVDWLGAKEARPASSISAKFTTAWRLMLPVAALSLVMAMGTGQLTIGATHDSPVPPKLYDLWVNVREKTPADALIFTDQTGDTPDRLGGWNDLALTAGRQFYIVSWSVSPLRGNEAARTKRLQQNRDVLSGKLAPPQLSLSRPYGAYYTAVRNDWSPIPGAQKIFDNDSYAIYRLAE